MTISEYNARFQQKHDTETNWNLIPDFIPKSGEIIIYDPDENNRIARVKIGNNNTPLINLPFINNNSNGQNQSYYKATQIELITWNNNTTTISVPDVTENSIIQVTTPPEYFETWAENRIFCSAQDNGTLTFTCEEVPTGIIKVNVLIFN